jgi:protein gp37
VRLSNGVILLGATWNVPGGCFHDCKWEMSDGSVAECYAKTTAEGLAHNSYPLGFRHHYWREHKLNEPLQKKTPCGIFLDSMSDLFGHWVPAEHIRAVLDVARRADWHVFFSLTKNAPRLREFMSELPPNLWVGVSMPPTFMNGKRLTLDQQHRMFLHQMDILAEVKEESDVVAWASLEPCSFDVGGLLIEDRVDHLDWVVIGAASNGKELYQPDPQHVENVLEWAARYEKPVYFKENLLTEPRREEFPLWPRPISLRSLVQLGMF